MRSFLGVLALTLMLAGCGGGTNSAQPVIDWVLAHCGVAVDGAAVAAVTASGQPLAGAAVSTVGHAICTAWQDSQSSSSTLNSAMTKQTPMVNGVPVNGQVVDKAKLNAYKRP